MHCTFRFPVSLSSGLSFKGSTMKQGFLSLHYTYWHTGFLLTEHHVSVIGILNLQVHRLESDVSAIEAALTNVRNVLKPFILPPPIPPQKNDFERGLITESIFLYYKKNGGQALNRCFECNVKDRYNVIALGSQSGVNVDKFLENLSGLRCKSQRECSELIDKGGSAASSRKDNVAQLTAESPSPKTDPKTFVTSNPALSGSSGLNFALLSAFKLLAVTLPLYYFFL